MADITFVESDKKKKTFLTVLIGAAVDVKFGVCLAGTVIRIGKKNNRRKKAFLAVLIIKKKYLRF